MCRREYLIILFSVLILSANTIASSYVLEELPHLHNTVLIAADVMNVGYQQLIVGKSNEVRIFDQNGTSKPIADIDGNVRALATGDLTGNFRMEVLVGTDNYSICVYKQIDQTWQQIEEIKYLWAPINYLEVADITGNGWGDVIALNTRGEAFIFLSWNGKLSLFWRSKPNETVKYITAADLTGNGADEVIFTHNSGYVAVLHWQEGQLDLVWQNFPWGSIDGLVITQLSLQQLPEITVTTGQNIFYSWQWKAEDLTISRHFTQELAGEPIMYMTDHGLINRSDAYGISAYEIGTNSLTEKWNIPLTGITDVILYNGRFLVKNNLDMYYLLHTINTDDIDVYFDHEHVDNPPQMLIYDGHVYLSLEDTIDRIGWLSFGTKRIFLIRGLDYFVIEPGKSTILWNNVAIPLTREIISHHDEIYIPLSALTMFGYEAVFDVTGFKLDIQKKWGWW